VYQTVGLRYRCRRCRYTFGDWTGRWVGRVRITATQWLWVLKLFELEVSAQRLLDLTLKKVRRGSIVYTDKFRGYDSLMFCGYRHLRLDHRKVFATGKVSINGLEGFWSYAKQRLMKFHGVSKRYFPLYLKEMEFRYNHREQSLFDLLAQLVTKPVSDR